MSNKTATLLCAFSVMLAGCGGNESDKHPTQPVKNRQAVFNKMLYAKDEIGLVLQENKPNDVQILLGQARELQRLSREPWRHFTPDSNYPPSRAKPQVWESPEKFTAGQRDLDESIAKLLKAAEAGELKAIRTAYVEVENDCMSCHKKFRNPIPLKENAPGAA